MSYILNLKIIGLPKSTMNANSSWRIRWAQAKKWKDLVAQNIDWSLKPKEPLKKAKVTLTRHAHGRRPDSDNLRSGFKHVLDGLVEAGVLIDDSFEIIGEPIINWVPEKPKHGHITILVEEV